MYRIFAVDLLEDTTMRPTPLAYEVYEEAFAKMQAATGISDIDELVENFINAEDQNFSLFTSLL